MFKNVFFFFKFQLEVLLLDISNRFENFRIEYFYVVHIYLSFSINSKILREKQDMVSRYLPLSLPPKGNPES